MSNSNTVYMYIQSHEAIFAYVTSDPATTRGLSAYKVAHLRRAKIVGHRSVKMAPLN